VNDIRKKYKKIKLNDLLEETNKILIESGHKKISLSSLKRHLKELKNMSEDGIKELYEDVKYTIKERERDLLDALESSDENSKKVKNCKKRLKQVKVKIKEEI
jgi:DNA replication initiation complex subunit (GINS family)